MDAPTGLALVRLTIGAMFIWVFFESLGKGLYSRAGYAGLISYYIQHGQSPATWKAIMAVAANHASIAAPVQALTEISLGVLLVLGLLTRPAGLVACGLLASLWVSEMGHRMDLGTARANASVARTRSWTGGPHMGCRRIPGAEAFVLAPVVT